MPDNADSSSKDSGLASSSIPSKLQDPLVFSIGPRDCIGQSLAKLELQVVLATLVGRFRFQLGPELAGGFADVTARAAFRVTLFPRGGMPLRAVPRVQP